jgi:tetratricopeptide (TPR) repeat protein
LLNASSMQILVTLMVALLLGGCATTTYQTDRVVKNHSHLKSEVKLSEVPFIKQKVYHCGPATMAMALQHAGKNIQLNDLTQQTYTSSMKGTFQSEMLSAARRNGMLAIPINTIADLLKELEAHHPVIVFQNLGFDFYPNWHYALAVGYKIKGPDLILHTGEKKFHKMDLRLFERSWKLAGYWGMIVLRPDQLSATASDADHVAAAARLEEMGMLEEAQVAYMTVVSRWPQSQLALLGLGNVFYKLKNYNASIEALRGATIHHPLSSMVWHNLAIAHGAAGNIKEARSSGLKALELVHEDLKLNYKMNLKHWLD